MAPNTNTNTNTTNSNNKFHILIFTKTASYRHASIPSGIAALRRLSEQTKGLFTTETSEDASLINHTYLSRFRVVVFLSTSGELLTSEQVRGLKAWVRSGGGFVGIHCAAAGLDSVDVDDDEHGGDGSSWYARLVGASFVGHPVPQRGVVRIEEGSWGDAGGNTFGKGFESERIVEGETRGGKKGHGDGIGGKEVTFEWFDEWYNFSWNPREKFGVTVLLTVDETSYEGGTMGKDHPIAWCREFEGGRSFYTALGHFDEAFEDERFMNHLLGGILWVARLAWGGVAVDILMYE